MAERFQDFLAKWWGALLATILAIVTSSVGYGVLVSKVGELATGQTRMESRQAKTNEHLNTIVNEMAAEKTAAAIIRRDVDDLRDRLLGRRQVQ